MLGAVHTYASRCYAALVKHKKRFYQRCAARHIAAGKCPKNAPFLGRSRLPPNTWFLGSPRVYTPNGSSIGSSVLAQLTVVTNRQTHRPRNISNNRPHLMLYIAMRPNNNTYRRYNRLHYRHHHHHHHRCHNYNSFIDSS